VFLLSISISTNDSIYASNSDTLNSSPDSLAPSKKEKSSLDTKIDYHAKDSMVFDMAISKVYLYGDAEITYGGINLKAAFIELNFKTNLVYATYVLDSNDQEIGAPEFKDGDESFKSRKMTYNFETKKGIIHEIFSEEAGGYMHGEKVKKEADNSVLIKNGAFF